MRSISFLCLLVAQVNVAQVNAASRQVYVELFESLTNEGCNACVSAGYGWSKRLSRCGGYEGNECDSSDPLKTKLTKESDESGSNPLTATPWSNTPTTTLLWELISSGNINGFEDLLINEPEVAKVRSEDGRGPLFWAMEYQNNVMVALLVKNGAFIRAKDSQGLSPSDMKALVSPSSKVEVDMDVDMDDDFNNDDDLEGYASAKNMVITAPKNRQEYIELFDELTSKGCKACRKAGYGWNGKKCGGFENVALC